MLLSSNALYPKYILQQAWPPSMRSERETNSRNPVFDLAPLLLHSHGLTSVCDKCGLHARPTQAEWEPCVSKCHRASARSPGLLPRSPVASAALGAATTPASESGWSEGSTGRRGSSCLCKGKHLQDFKQITCLQLSFLEMFLWVFHPLRRMERRAASLPNSHEAKWPPS